MKRSFAVLAGLVFVAVTTSSWAADFRIYRANEDLQLDRVPTLNEDEPGCHSMLLTLRIYRVAQIGFEYCTVFSEKDCKAGTEVPVSWKKEEAPVTQFTQGDRWFLVSDHPQGHDMGSWYCKARE